MIVKKDMSLEYTNDNVRAYIASHTYILESDTWLWEKINYALPEKPLSVYRDQEAKCALPGRQDLVGYTPMEPHVDEETRRQQHKKVCSSIARQSKFSRYKQLWISIGLAFICYLVYKISSDVKLLIRDFRSRVLKNY